MHRERSGDDLVFLKKSNVQLILYALASLLEDHKGAWMHALSPRPTPAAVCVVMQRAMKICLYMNRLANEMGSRASSCPCLIPASPKGTIINSVALSRGYKLKLEALVEGHEWRWDSWVTDHPLTGKKVWVDIRIFQETWLMCKSHFLFCVLWGFKWFGLLFADRGQMFRTMSQIVLRQKTCHDQIYWRQTSEII